MSNSLLNVTFDTTQVRAFLEAKLQRIQAVRPRLAFDLYNIARDMAAIAYHRPNQAIFYYEAINSGRRGFEVHIGSRGPNQQPELKFKISEFEWVTTLEVGPVEPRRITEASVFALRQVFLDLIDRSLEFRRTASETRMPLPDGPDLIQFVEAMKSEVVRVFSAVTRDRTILYNVKERFYQVASTPLSEAFRTVPRGSQPPSE